MKKLICLTLSFLLLFSFTACKKKELPPELTEENVSVVQSPYADATTTDRFYLSVMATSSGLVYGSDYYYCDSAGVIIKNPLPAGDAEAEPAVLCADPLCNHFMSGTCTAYVRDPGAQILIDAAESDGGQPVFYYSRTINGSESEIIRTDTGANQTLQVAVVDSPIEQLMAYKDRLYFTTQTSDDTFELNMVQKSGGEVRTLSTGDSYLQLIGANPQGVYCNDEKGNVYASDLELKSEKIVYTVKEVYPLVESRPAELSMFVEGDYLYFFADFKSEYFPWFNNADYGDKILFLNHSIRRVRLDDPQGDGEVVADEVFEYAVYGVYNGVLYYGPFIVETLLSGVGHENSAPFYHSKGTIRGVRLDTLETFDAVSDCGMNFERGPYYINDRCIIGTHHPYRDGVGLDYRNSGGIIVLYDFETGAMYNVYNSEIIMQGNTAE